MIIDNVRLIGPLDISMEMIIDNVQIIGPFGALIALVITFDDKLQRQLPSVIVPGSASPRYSMAPIWMWFQRVVTPTIPLIGLVALLALLIYVFTREANVAMFELLIPYRHILRVPYPSGHIPCGLSSLGRVDRS